MVHGPPHGLETRLAQVVVVPEDSNVEKAARYYWFLSFLSFVCLC